MDPEVLKFECKVCDKKYPCVKSLGGHMKSHVIAATPNNNTNNNNNSVESDEFAEPMSLMKKVTSPNLINIEVGGGPYSGGYELRENPKKSWRAVDSTTFTPSAATALVVQMEHICNKCGKGFQSTKALCGHMACHSEKERVLKDDHSWTSVMDSYSDTEEPAVAAEEEDLLMRRQSRSKSKRYKKLLVKTSPSSHFNNNNGGSNSSAVSEVDELEQEEVAMCLMMLSRDTSQWGGVNSVVESSDNNSVVLETKSSSIEMKNIGIKQGGLSFGELKKLGGGEEARKLKSRPFDVADQSVQFENSYSGYLRNGMRRVDSDISVDHELVRYGNGGFNKQPKGAGVEVFDDELGKGVSWGKTYESGLSKAFAKDKAFGTEVSSSSKSVKYDSKRSRDDFDGIDIRRKEALRKLIYDDSSDGELSKKVHKRCKYECLNCNKTFNSHQALGGHRPCHRKAATFANARYQNRDNSLEDDDITPDSLTVGKLGERASNKKYLSSNAAGKKVKSKKSKGHECPFCFRMFKSGQALGGHKRSHFINGSEDFISRAPVINQEEAADVHDLIDLNLPVPEEDETDDNNQFIYQD